MSAIKDEEAVRNAYKAVRDDAVNQDWALLGYEGRSIVYLKSGVAYDNFLKELKDDERFYGYVRIETGDEQSRRAKFAFITWIGPSVPPLKKAKVSTDKAFVKAIFKEYAKEILADEKKDIQFETVKHILEAASGAGYGTGK